MGAYRLMFGLLVTVFLTIAWLGCGDESEIQPLGTTELSLEVDCVGLNNDFGTVEVVRGQADYLDPLERVQFAVPIDNGAIVCNEAGDPIPLTIGPVLLPAGRFAANLQALGTGPCAPGQYQILETATVVCDTGLSATAPCSVTVRPFSCPTF